MSDKFDPRRYTFRKPAGLTPEMEGYFYTGPTLHRGSPKQPPRTSKTNASGGGGVCHGHEVRSKERCVPCILCEGWGWVRDHERCTACRGEGWFPLIELKIRDESTEAASRFFGAPLRRCVGEECNTLLLETGPRLCKRCTRIRVERREKHEKRARGGKRKRVEVVVRSDRRIALRVGEGE